MILSIIEAITPTLTDTFELVVGKPEEQVINDKATQIIILDLPFGITPIESKSNVIPLKYFIQLRFLIKSDLKNENTRTQHTKYCIPMINAAVEFKRLIDTYKDSDDNIPIQSVTDIKINPLYNWKRLNNNYSGCELIFNVEINNNNC